jgi:hypothetical protein
VLTTGTLPAAATLAADGVSLEIGGRYKGAAGLVASEDFSGASVLAGGDMRGYVFKQDVEIDFEGEAELDNGLTVGVAIQLEGQTDDEDQVSDVYAFFSGGFGELRFGDTEEAYAQLCYQVPTASELFGADSPDFNFSNAGVAGYAATNGTCYGLDDNATKVVYFTPEIAGFQFAASFAPDASEDTRNTLDGAATRFSDDAEQNSETLSLAANFKHDLNGIEVILGGGATLSFDKEANLNDTGKARGYNAYAQLAFSGFVLGAAAELRENFGGDGADQLVYGAGATYGWSAWTIGVGWTRGDYENAVGANDGDPFNAGHDIYSATASYALAPGVSVDGVIEYSGYGSNDAAGPDYQGLAIGLGTLIAF